MDQKKVEATTSSWDLVTLDQLRQDLDFFATQRDWNQYHLPRNLLLALVAEVGELSEIFQWQGEVEKGLTNFSEDQKIHTAEELADILLYTIRLADRCGIDLASAAKSKMKKNAIKYPVDKCKGSNAKYTAYASSTE